VNGSKTLLVAVSSALLGFFVGRSFAPPALVFPDPSVGRGAAEMQAEVLRALDEPRGFPRASILIRLFEGLTPANVGGAASAFELRATHHDPTDLQLFLTAWAHIDGGSAMQAVRSWEPRSRSDLGIRIVMREWAASGAKIEAAGFFQTLNDPEIRRIAAGPLVRGWVLAGDLEGARGIAAQLWSLEPPIDVSEAVVRGVLQARGADGVLAMVDELPDLTLEEAGFDRRVAQVSLSLAGLEKPEEAALRYAEFEAQGDGDTSWLGGALKHIATPWIRSDAPAALDWLTQRRASEERDRALMDGMRVYALSDLEGAKARVSTPAPADDAHAREVEQLLLDPLLRRWARVDPEAAAGSLARVTNPAQRANLASRIAFFWAPKDRAAAEAWLASQDLTPEQRQEAQQAIERMGTR
jgi:hypothetical protein